MKCLFLYIVRKKYNKEFFIYNLILIDFCNLILKPISIRQPFKFKFKKKKKIKRKS